MPDKAKRLLERMRQSTANLKRHDLIELYLAYGFQIRHGSKHDVVAHPMYPDLRATVARHNDLARGYFRTAVSLIDELEKRTQAERTETDREDNHESD